MASPIIAGMLGRQDLSSAYGGVVVSPDGTAAPVVMTQGAAPLLSGNLSASASASVGQLSLSLLAVGTVGLLLFYGWTRGVQH